MSEDLPPKHPALFALGVLCQAWFVIQPKRERRRFVKSLRRLLALYREDGSELNWRTELSGEDIRETAWTAMNWLSRLCDKLERLAE